jgi:uncharacterized membrane protein YphA (DoxX/SURF4 family)
MTVVVIALAVLFLASGASKLVRHPVSVTARDKLAIPANLWNLIGAAEVAGAAGVLVGLTAHPLGIAAATGLVIVGAGALAAHRKAHDPLPDAVPAVFAVLLAVATLVLFSTGT